MLSLRISKASLWSEPFIAEAAKPEPISKPFVAGQTEHRLGEVRLEFVEHRFTQTGWPASDDALDNSA